MFLDSLPKGFGVLGLACCELSVTDVLDTLRCEDSGELAGAVEGLAGPKLGHARGVVCWSRAWDNSAEMNTLCPSPRTRRASSSEQNVCVPFVHVMANTGNPGGQPLT